MTSGCDERLREVKWSEELCVFMCVCVCVCVRVHVRVRERASE